MYCLCFVLLLTGSIAAAQAAEDFPEPAAHLPSPAPLHAPSDQAARPGGSVVLLPPAAMPGAGANGDSGLPPPFRPQHEALWTTNSRWQPITLSGDGRVSLSPILLSESKDEKLEIKPKRNSLWMLWRKKFQ
ncbi:MAG TPA: hypothetical protein VFW53_11025 [Gallionella sp.]|nr:hypothetical protein [Gallionella sp.]